MQKYTAGKWQIPKPFSKSNNIFPQIIAPNSTRAYDGQEYKKNHNISI